MLRRLVAPAAGLAAASALLQAAHADAEPQFSPELVVGLGSVTSAAVSPAGTHVLWREQIPSPEGSAATLLLRRVEGGDQHAAVPYSAPGSSPRLAAWSPDGSRIFFVSRGALHAVPVDGGAPRAVLEPDEAIRCYAVSPDGRRVAFVALEPKPKPSKSKSKSTVTVSDDPERACCVYVSSLDDDDEPVALPAVGGAVSGLAWSPDGSQLVATASPSRSADDTIMRRGLWLFDLSQPSQPSSRALGLPHLGPAGGKLSSKVSFSPDGTRLLIVAGESPHDPAVSTAFVMDVSSGEVRRITAADYEGHVEQAEWLGDSSIALLCAEGTTVRLFDVDLTERRPTRELVSPGAWSSFSLSPSVVALVGSTASHPSEAFVSTVGSDEAPRRCSETNAPLPTMGEQRIFTYVARDGLPLEAVLILPPGAKEGAERLPVVVGVHGGPEAHCRDGWLTTYSRPGQLLANRGFIVVYPNYRGSTGRGVGFSQLSQGRLGQEDMDDLVDCVEALVAQGLADPERVGLVGVSYGGYAAGVAATRHSSSFAAAVMMCGVSDQLSKLYSTDIPFEMEAVHWRTNPTQGLEPFIAGSPIFFLEGAKTPLLIAHGKADPRVPFGQAKELYTALQSLEQPPPLRLVAYGGEGHGNKKWANRVDFSARQLRWLEHFVLPAAAQRPSSPPPVAP